MEEVNNERDSKKLLESIKENILKLQEINEKKISKYVLDMLNTDNK